MTPELLGPLGVTVGAIALVTLLGRLHLQEDERTRKRLEDTEKRLDLALTGMKDHANVSDRAVALAEGAINALRSRN